MDNKLQNLKVTEIHIMVLLQIYRGCTMRSIAETVGKSLGWVQQICFTLEEQNYLENPYLTTGKRRFKARILTPKGKQYLSKQGLLKNEL